jgi:hypothetical protein
MSHTCCSSFVEEKATACHSDPALREKNPGICLALIELSNAGILLPQGGIRMTGDGVVLHQ